MTINATAAILLCLYRGGCQKAGALTLRNFPAPRKTTILKEYIARGTYIYPVQHAMRIVTRYFQLVPRLASQVEYHLHFRFITFAKPARPPLQEVAFTLADGIAYVEAALRAGLAIDEFARSFPFSSMPTMTCWRKLPSSAPARRLWARIMRDRFHAQDPRSLLLRFHAQTAGSSLTAQQPEGDNIVRVAIQALAAVLGGCQSLHTNSMDEALALPTEESALIAIAHAADHRQ